MLRVDKWPEKGVSTMAKREYRNNNSSIDPVPGPVSEPAEPAAPVKKAATPRKVQPASSGAAQPPKKGTKRADVPPSRFEQLRSMGRSWVDGVVDALDDAFGRLDAHEERLDAIDRRFEMVDTRCSEIERHITALEERPAPAAPEPARPAGVTITIKVEGGDVSIE